MTQRRLLDSSPTLHLSKLGINHRQLFRYVLLWEAEHGSGYPMDVYDTLKGELVGKGISQSHFYRTVAELEQLGLLQLIGYVNGKKKYTITDAGREQCESIYQESFEPLSRLKNIAQLFIHDITGQGGRRGEVKPLDKKDRRFFGSLVNVRHVIAYVMLKEMINAKDHEPIITQDVWRSLGERYGWKPAYGYMYDVVRELENDIWIYGQWDDERKRSRRLYWIDDRGRAVFPQIEESVLFSMRRIRKFVGSVVDVFESRPIRKDL
ncbi:helix-turn-helix transcriptional regulator [Aneurinibacillus thermoaerophilus]|uniref:helix-turn-helix transcriptional regulator n=1 Tax=Aneurinibacillus thermoaerophilus TaxID=143495 RepID=UPI002E1FE66D|nr:helix-turn-helix transcriptional regulator [Aneurinibacillus thermoaerophilus]